MKKFSSILFVFLLTSTFFIHGVQTDVHVIKDDELIYVGDEVFFLGDNVFRYPKIAETFCLYMYASEYRATVTHLISYVQSSSGLYHVGWYADGFILTCMEDGDKGRQIVINNDKIVGISYGINNNPDSHAEGIRHEYNWGCVGTTEGFQIINVSKKSLWPGSPAHFKNRL